MKYSICTLLFFTAAVAVLLTPIAIFRSYLSLAERNGLAMKQAVSLTQSFVTANDGIWPSSIEDLERYATDDIDVKWTIENVEYDFHADVRILRDESKYGFSGIRPKTPFYDRYENELLQLMETIRKLTNQTAE